MKWTNARPNKDGFYWLQHYVRYTIEKVENVTEIVELHTISNSAIPYKDSWVMFTGTDEDAHIDEFNDTCFWYGPLEPPEFKL